MQLGIELTHRCNLAHPLCDHRIAGSDYELTWAQFERVLAHLGPGDDVVLVGGEPLVHPLFREIAGMLLARGFPVQVKTNGLALPLYDDALVDRLDVRLQHYPGENDAVARCYGDRPGVEVKAFRGWWDPNRDPDLDERAARRVRLNCSVEMRVYGDRLYSCCVSEGIERHSGTDPAHVPFDAGWRDWRRVPTWRACRHCFRAIDRGLI